MAPTGPKPIILSSDTNPAPTNLNLHLNAAHHYTGRTPSSPSAILPGYDVVDNHLPQRAQEPLTMASTLLPSPTPLISVGQQASMAVDGLPGYNDSITGRISGASLPVLFLLGICLITLTGWIIERTLKKFGRRKDEKCTDEDLEALLLKPE